MFKQPTMSADVITALNTDLLTRGTFILIFFMCVVWREDGKREGQEEGEEDREGKGERQDV
jgi:hypothetical protein